MKKTLYTYILVLVGVFVILSFLDRGGQYAVEQRLWRANKKLAKVIQDPSVVPDKTYEDIALEYEKIVQDFPDSYLKSRSQMLLAQVYSTKKDYVTARKKLEEVEGQYSDDPKVQSEAAMEIAKTFEKESNWRKAEETYSNLVEKYPSTDIGLNVPLYMANYYREKKQSARADEAFNFSIKHYKKLAEENPNSEIEYKALKNLGNAYLLEKKWREGLDVFGEILMKYPSPRIGGQVIQTINAISVIELKDFNTPIEIYQKIIDQTPDHPLRRTLEKMVAGFKDLKNKNVQISTQDKP